jgi:hypothetical protein
MGVDDVGHLGGAELAFGQCTSVCLPLGDRTDAVSKQECTPGSVRHPRRHAQAVLVGGGHDAGVNLWIDGDREFR